MIRSPRDDGPEDSTPSEHDSEMRLDLFPSEHDGESSEVDSIESTYPSEYADGDAHDAQVVEQTASSATPTVQFHEPVLLAPPVVESPRGFRVDVLAGAALIAVIASGAYFFLRAPQTVGSLRVETDAVGADVVVDGQAQGKTPLLLSLAPGEHTVQVSQAGASKALTVTIAERTTVVHHVSFPPAPVPGAKTGGIEIVSDPVGQNVVVDGQPRGVTPVTVTDLTPGRHDVIVRRDTRFVQRTVQVEAGKTISLMLTPGANAGLPSGWIGVSSAVPLQIFEGTQLVGSSASARLMVPAGPHTYEFVNEPMGVRVTQRVQVVAGQTATISVPLPRGTVNVNATPWAEVWLDGQPLGETPIGNVSWPIGTHDVVLRHPELGERRVAVTITTGQTARVAVDMRATP